MWPESAQARATLIAGIALALASSLFSVIQSDYFNLLTILVFMSPMIILSAYDVQCIVTGQCEVYSWIKTLIFLLVIALAFYAEAFLQHYNKSVESQPRQQIVYVSSSPSPTVNRENSSHKKYKHKDDDNEDDDVQDSSGNKGWKDSSGNCWEDTSGNKTGWKDSSGNCWKNKKWSHKDHFQMFSW